MKKAAKKKLALAKETLRKLAEGDMRHVAGGTSNIPSVCFICKRPPV